MFIPECRPIWNPPDCGTILPAGNFPSYGTTKNGAVEELIFKSNPTTLSGIPGANGWVFTWDDCCRNAAIVNLLVPQEGFTLRAKMFRTNNANGTGKNMNPCFDNSPRFSEKPASVLAAGYLNSYSPNAFDPELDSLVYTWANPLDEFEVGAVWGPGSPDTLLFSGGMSKNSPFPQPSLAFPNNVPASLDPITGTIVYRCDQPGDYVNVNCVTAYKCGNKVAEIFRDMQVSVFIGTANLPPNVLLPFSNHTSSDTTVTAGDLISFDLFASDNDTLGDGSPQTISMSASGGQFDTTSYDTASTNCNKPPCAGISPSMPLVNPSVLNGKFVWQTECNHLSYLTTCYSYSNTYTFQFIFADDNCPAPAKKSITATIHVLNRPPIDASKFVCTKVAPNGDVTLNWIPPIDSLHSFDSYHIYGSVLKNGPYTDLDSIDTLSVNTTTIVGANATTNPVYYFVQTRSTCNGKVRVNSDTLRTILTSVTNSGNNNASIVWNAPHKPLAASTTSPYKIYRKVNGIWTAAPIALTTDTFYVDTIAVCNELVEYRVELEDANCTTVSSIGSDNFSDTVVPDIPQLIVASVNFTNDLATLSWHPTYLKDTKGYYVYQYIGGTYNVIDTLIGINDTTYTFLASTAGIAPESFAIAAFDSCSNTSPIGNYFTTSNLTVFGDLCNGSNNLTWTPYTDFVNGLSGYNVYVSVNSSPYSFLATVNPSLNEYIHANVVNGTQYDYYVSANDAGSNYRATTNHVSQLATVLKLPQFTYVRYASVTTNEKIDLAFIADTSAIVRQYNVYRAENINGPYNLIGSVPYDTNYTHYYSDVTALPSERSYFYKVISVDDCNTERAPSNVSKTILLKADENLDMVNLIIWSDYRGWPNGVNDVKLYRYVDGNKNLEPIALVPFTTNRFQDDVSTYASYNGEFCYSVIAREAAGNPYNYADSAQSNIMCFDQQSTMYIPNAFSPTGANPIFKPHTVFVNTEGYLLRIFNKWGNMLFETTNPDKGWDGKVNGELVPDGVYIYVMKYQNSAGAPNERRGALTIVR
ncbi:MAG: gliding motility-associated C-terminal domain-containing protein [Bacteroidetes bacterium]|nr:gliding motility-associated C-terminal domain-containing protein [Bacteroidota bacterium]